MAEKLFGPIFIPDRFREAVSGRAWLQAMLEAEGALAVAQARAGLIPVTGFPVYAVIEHRSFTPHGTTELIIKDAAGSVMYDAKLLEEDEDRDDQTLSGIPGEWTVIFSLDQSVARIDVTLDAAWPPD